MSFKRHKKQDICGSQIERPDCNRNLGACSQTSCSNDMDGKRSHFLAKALATLPRGHKHLGMTRSNSSIDAAGSGSQRRLLLVVKQDNESFGFEIQTYKLQHQHSSEFEVCTYVCKVHENSPSSRAGLKIGDMLTNINGTSTAGFSHQQMVDLIRSSGNYLRIHTMNGTKIRRSELEAKLLFLKQDLQEKLAELQTVIRKEQQLSYGAVNESKVQEEMDSVQSRLCARPTASCSFLNKHRVSSGSSCKSRFSLMSDSSDGGLCQASVFDEDSGSEVFSRQSSIEDDCFLFNAKKSTLTRHRSISVTSSGSESMSPSWDSISLSNFFGTLPRKGRRGSIRKHLLKFIPGLHRSVEEEESQV
ncbi:cytohesin-interacting protein [Rhinophrynus dorsalis]